MSTPAATAIEAALKGLPVLENRRPDTPEEVAGAAFATLSETERGGVYAGSFNGESAWERHANGDELVQVLRGAATLVILTEDARVEHAMTAGMVTIVPKGAWHRFLAPEGVTLMTMTPMPTDHSTADDPRLG